MFVIVSLFCFGIYLLAPTKQAKANPKQTGTASPMPTEAGKGCKVKTGLSDGRVNLRACDGTSCPVLLILVEGQALTIIQAGAWNQVITDDGVTGYINSIFCSEVKP